MKIGDIISADRVTDITHPPAQADEGEEVMLMTDLGLVWARVLESGDYMIVRSAALSVGP